MVSKSKYPQNNGRVEERIYSLMEDLNLEETSKLLDDMREEKELTDLEYIQEIKKRTFEKLGRRNSFDMKYDGSKEELSAERSTGISSNLWRRYSAAAVILLLIFAAIFRDNIVLAVQNMLSLIPGVGIVENNEEAGYRLEDQVSVTRGQTTLDILYVTVMDDTMTVRFDIKGMYAEGEKRKREEKEGGTDPKVYLLAGKERFAVTVNSRGGGLSDYRYSYSCNYQIKIDSNYINSKKNYTLVCENYDIKAEFKLVKIDQYHNLNEIGDTQEHNGISLTAAATQKEGKLSVNIYPVNNSDYNLISFDREFNPFYFGKKMVLNTDQGVKNYTPPSYYGTGINAAFLFDVSDGAGDLKLSIPYIVVESKEEKNITLPLPQELPVPADPIRGKDPSPEADPTIMEEGDIVEVNQEVVLEHGSVIITSVERQKGDIGNKYGYLKINLEYRCPDDMIQLVGVEFTGKNSVGYYLENDRDNRISTVSYMLNEQDKGELQLKIINPRYVLMDQYELNLLP